MNRIDKVAKTLRDTDVLVPHRGMDETASQWFARALDADGHLAPAPQIIRTAQELDALDDDTLLSTVAEHDRGDLARSARMIRRCYLTDDEDQAWPLPAVVVASGAHVRKCRETLEGETT